MGHERLRGIEAARAIAAMLVLLYHATHMLAGHPTGGAPPLHGAFSFGSVGVDIFFVLSGFIIAHVHGRDVGHRAALPGFAWRRLSRIFPLYWVVLGIYAGMLAISPSHDGFERDAVTVWTSVLLLPDPQGHTILGVAWTLKHELLFYAMFALAIRHRRVGGVLLALWTVLTALVAVFGWQAGFPADFVLSPFNLEFMVGLVVCAALRLRTLGSGAAPLAAGVTFAVFAVNFWATSAWLHPQICVAAGLGLYGLVRLERAGRLAVPSWLVLIGGASYSIYLTHTLFIMILDQTVRMVRAGAPLDINVGFILISGGALAFGLLFHVTVERPLLARIRVSGRQWQLRRLGRARSRA